MYRKEKVEENKMKIISKPEEKMVIAVQDGCGQDFQKAYLRIAQNSGFKHAAWLGHAVDFDPEMTDTIKAITKCDEKDEFCEDFGIELTKNKIKEKRARAVMRKAESLFMKVRDLMVVIQKVAQEANRERVKAQEKIDIIIDEAFYEPDENEIDDTEFRSAMALIDTFLQMQTGGAPVDEAALESLAKAFKDSQADSDAAADQEKGCDSCEGCTGCACGGYNDSAFDEDTAPFSADDN